MTEVIMKKLIKGLIAICMAVCCLLGVVSCDVIKNGSKLQAVTVTLNVNGVEEDFNFELYLNLAPGTIDHFTYLVNEGYYDNTIVSNVKGHVEFGAYDSSFNSKYGEGAKSYYSLINANTVKDKYVGPAKDARYDSKFNVVGEFASNGYVGNSLSLDGALVLKREDLEDVNSARATMAITFGSDSYFTSANDFAVIGKILTDDAEDEDETSYNRLKAIMSEYAEDEHGNVYYNYAYVSGDRKDDYGTFFMLSEESGMYYAKDANGEYTIEIVDDESVEEDAGEILLKEFSTNSKYLNVIPYGDVVITVSKIVFKK